jgi:predicted nucleic acid-binding protein
LRIRDQQRVAVRGQERYRWFYDHVIWLSVLRNRCTILISEQHPMNP